MRKVDSVIHSNGRAFDRRDCRRCGRAIMHTGEGGRSIAHKCPHRDKCRGHLGAENDPYCPKCAAFLREVAGMREMAERIGGAK